MKFALVDGTKTEASKGVRGTCPSCGSELIARCGNVYANHWAHKGERNCDPWWEETEWHRLWKGYFPFEWQEVVHTDKNGEKHIADVKTAEKWVLEFQHSPINPEERRSRNTFYSKIVWIVDGLRRVRDKSQFEYVLKDGTGLKYGNILIHRVSLPKESRLLNEWLSSGVPVFFDFRGLNESKPSALWFLIPKISSDIAYLIPFSRSNFIELHSNKGFDEMAYEIIPKIRDYLLRYEKNRSQIRFVNPYRRRNSRRF